MKALRTRGTPNRRRGERLPGLWQSAGGRQGPAEPLVACAWPLPGRYRAMSPTTRTRVRSEFPGR